MDWLPIQCKNEEDKIDYYSVGFSCRIGRWVGMMRYVV